MLHIVNLTNKVMSFGKRFVQNKMMLENSTQRQ